MFGKIKKLWKEEKKVMAILNIEGPISAAGEGRFRKEGGTQEILDFLYALLDKDERLDGLLIRMNTPGGALAEKGQQQLVYPVSVPQLHRQRQRRRTGRVPAVQAVPPGRPALELCPLRSDAGRRKPCPLGKAAHRPAGADACQGRKAGRGKVNEGKSLFIS